MDISTDTLIVTAAMAAREETSPRVAGPLDRPTSSERLQLQTPGRDSFATRAMWQTRRLYSAEGYER
jgi:hypothetical protein